MSSSPPPDLFPDRPDPSQNPRNWRFTWEAQSHIPTVRLYLFNPIIRPATQCTNLEVKLIVERSLLLVSFSHGEAETSLCVPLPGILLDYESPVHLKAHDDHIEVKLVLLLPVDHPLVSEFGLASDDLQPLSADSDLKKLSALEEVYFYCRSCSTKLTRPLRLFKEMPSVNWQDVADNWFGSCCCSFGGIGEKMVTRYAKSYTCAAGVCLLDTAAVILCKDDLIGCEFLNWNPNQNEFKPNLANDSVLIQDTLGNGIEQGQAVCFKKGTIGEQDVDGKESHVCCEGDNLNTKLEHEAIENVTDRLLSCISSQLQDAENWVTLAACSTDTQDKFGNCDTGCCRIKLSEGSSEEQKSGKDIQLLAHQKILLDGFLWNGFVARLSNHSKDVHWAEFLCPRCSCLLGAYPCFDDNSMLDGGVRLFKCHISTCLPVLESNDLFRTFREFVSLSLNEDQPDCSISVVGKGFCSSLGYFDFALIMEEFELAKVDKYSCVTMFVDTSEYETGYWLTILCYSLERMFTTQLLESAKEELSFRTVVRDIRTNRQMLQLVLLNPDSWCHSGYCLYTTKSAARINMYPTIKLLFSACSKDKEMGSRKLEEQISKDEVEELYMLPSLIKELMTSLESANGMYPPSQTSLQGLLVSSMKR